MKSMGNLNGWKRGQESGFGYDTITLPTPLYKTALNRALSEPTLLEGLEISSALPPRIRHLERQMSKNM
jgi:hypothetical protein